MLYESITVPDGNSDMLINIIMTTIKLFCYTLFGPKLFFFCYFFIALEIKFVSCIECCKLKRGWRTSFTAGVLENALEYDSYCMRGN